MAIVSGGGAGLLAAAAAAGYDAFLTGEPAEPTMMAARELGIHFIAGGHYATERLGVQALSRAARRGVRPRLALHRADEPGLTASRPLRSGHIPEYAQSDDCR